MEGFEQQALVEAARGGDNASWEALYRAVYPRLLAFARHRVGPSAAEDIVSETMTRAVAGIDRYRWTEVGFDPWLFGIARRVAADHHRQATRTARQVKAVAAAPDDGRLSSEELPGELLEQAADHDQLRRAFARLNPAERELLELRVVGGLTGDQTAAALGKRAGAIRTAQSRALAHLREYLQADQ